MKKFVDLIFRARKGIIVIVLLISAFFGYQLRYLSVNSDIFSYLPKTDSAVSLYTEISDKFGGNQLVLIAIRDPQLFSKLSFERLANLTEKLKSLQGISSVTSLTDVIDIKKAEDGGIEIARLVDPANLPESPAAFEKLKNYVLSQKLYRGRLLSSNGDMTCLVCQLAPESDEIKMVTTIKSEVAKANLPLEIFYGGVPVMLGEITKAIFSDLKTLIPIVTMLIVITLFVSFGTWRGVIIPLVSVGIATIWTLGLMSFLRVPLTIISDIIPVLLIAIGTAPCIHILSKYDEDPLNRYGSTGQEPRAAFGEVGLRVILAALTIIFGFTSCIFGSYLTMIKDFGIYSSIGVFFSLVISIVFVPALLTYIKIKPRPRKVNQGRGTASGISAVMHKASGFILKNEIAIIIAGCVVLGIGLLGIPRIGRNVDLVDYFKKSSPVRSGESVLEKEFGGSRPIQIRFKGDMQDPFLLKEISRTERYLSSFGFINNMLSVADLLAQMNDVMGEGRIIPESGGKVSNLYFLIDGQEILTHLVNDDKTEGIVTAMTGYLTIDRMRTIVDSIDTYIQSIDTCLVGTAYSDLASEERDKLYQEQIRRIIQQIVWSISGTGTCDTTIKHRIAGVISGPEVCALYTLPDSVVLDSIAPVLTQKILGILSPSLRTDQFLIKDITADILELGQKQVALPQSRWHHLGLHPQSTTRIPLNAQSTGMPLIYKHLDDSLIKSQYESFALALLFIFVLLAIQLRSLKSGMLGLAPIVLTVVLVFGIMGYLHIPIDVATVLVASIALGIGIDYSIHFNVRFNSYFKTGITPRDALDKTLQTTGKAIIINVLAVTMGFITLLFAGLVPLQRFGLLISITMIGSGLGALTMLPSLILVFSKKRQIPTQPKEAV
jgi:predicted RND superfamily exporter protein